MSVLNPLPDLMCGYLSLSLFLSLPFFLLLSRFPRKIVRKIQIIPHLQREQICTYSNMKQLHTNVTYKQLPGIRSRLRINNGRIKIDRIYTDMQSYQKINKYELRGRQFLTKF